MYVALSIGLDLIDVLLGSGSKKHGRHGNKSWHSLETPVATITVR